MKGKNTAHYCTDIVKDGLQRSTDAKRSYFLQTVHSCIFFFDNATDVLFPVQFTVKYYTQLLTVSTTSPFTQTGFGSLLLLLKK